LTKSKYRVSKSEVEIISQAELDAIISAINEFDPEKVKDASKRSLQTGIPVADVIQKGISVGLQDTSCSSSCIICARDEI
jgi:hypothetical protein